MEVWLRGTYRPREGCEGDADDLMEDERLRQISRGEPLVDEVILDSPHASRWVTFASDDGKRRCEQEGGEQTNPCRRLEEAFWRSPFPPLSTVVNGLARRANVDMKATKRQRRETGEREKWCEKKKGHPRRQTPIVLMTFTPC